MDGRVEGQLQSAVLSAARYYQNRTDTIARASFESKLDALVTATQNGQTGCEINVDQLCTQECLSYCVSCLASPDVPESVTNRIISFLFNVAWCNVSVRNYLQNSLHLAGCLTGLYAAALNRDELHSSLVPCLRLLQVVTYQTDCCSKTGFDLINYLVVQILSPHDDILPYVLGIMTNMCTQSMNIRDHIRRMDNAKTVYRQLMLFLAHSNFCVVITALSLVSRLSDEMRERVFNSKNTVQTLQLMFNVIIKGDKFMARHYACDLFKHIINYSSMEKTIAAFKYLTPTLSQIVSLLVKPDIPTEQLRKIYDLIFALCSHESLKRPVCSTIAMAPATDRNRLMTPILAMVETARLDPESCPLPELPQMAIRLLTIVLEDLIKSGSRVLEFVSSDVLVQLIESCLKTTLETGHRLVKLKCERLVNCLQLVYVLVDDNDFRGDLQEVLSANLCAHLAEFQFLSNPVAVAPGAGRSVVQSDWSPLGIDLILQLLSILDKLQSQPHYELYEKLLKDSRLLPFLAYAITSENKDRVQKALKMVLKCANLHDFPSNWLGDLIAANITSLTVYSRNKVFKEGDGVTRQMPDQMVDSGVWLNGNGCDQSAMVSSKMLNSTSATNNTTALLFAGTLDASKIDELIGQFKSGMTIKDAKVSQLMEVYERKIAGLEARERQLQELLQSKNSSLQYSERFLAQYRSQKNEVESETSKLRSLILEAELKSEQAASSVTTMQQENHNLKSELKQQRVDLETKEREIDGWRDLEAEYKLKIQNVMKSLETSKQEIENEKELHTVLRKHYDSMKQKFDETSQKLIKADEETKSLKRLLKEKDSDITKHKTVAERLESKLSAKSEEIEEMQKRVEKLQGQLQSWEVEKKQLQKQIAESEAEIGRRKSIVRELEGTIEDLRNENKKYLEIRALMTKLATEK